MPYMPVMHIFIVVLHDVHMPFQLEPLGADTQNQPCVYGGGGGILSQIHPRPGLGCQWMYIFNYIYIIIYYNIIYNDTTGIERMHQILVFFSPSDLGHLVGVSLCIYHST